MLVADYIPLQSAFLCQNCQNIGNSGIECAACASKTSLMSVALVMNRESVLSHQRTSLSDEGQEVMNHFRTAVHVAYNGAFIEVVGALAADSTKLRIAESRIAALTEIFHDRCRADFPDDKSFTEFIKEVVQAKAIKDGIPGVALTAV